jgi:hypothetical protein
MRDDARRWGLAVLIGLWLVGCTLVENKPAPDTAYADLTTRLAETQQSQAAALALWDRVIFGEEVSCQDVIPTPDRLELSQGELAAHPGADTIQARLNEAIKALHDSSDLWNIECQDERPYVPLNMAKAGREAALGAAEPLNAAAALLSTWTPK